MNCYITNVKQHIKICYEYSKFDKLPYKYIKYDKVMYKLKIKTNKDFYHNEILNKDIIQLDVVVENLHELKSYFIGSPLLTHLNDNKYYIVYIKINRTTITSIYTNAIDIIVIGDLVDIAEQPLQKIRDYKLSNIW